MPDAAFILAFTSSQAWSQWLAKHFTRTEGIWLRIFKKDSGQASVTYDEALDEALCYGWIDGQKKAYDQKSWIRKFTPRRGKSLWSKRNVENVVRLIKQNRMKPSGLREVQAAQEDGRWEAAYASQKTMEVPDDFLKALAKNKKAEALFKTLNKANLYAIAWRLATAKKPETRKKRFDLLLTMMKKSEKLH
jgi:uncharacterized protein YdeI (YjbR/CyaY-like superfamily)